jgi:iron complex outermembrane receptor protein
MNKRMNALSLAVTVAIFPAAAQQQAVTPGERIEITGSNIKRIEGETALPVTVISRAQLEQQGIQTAAEAVDRLSANSSIGGVNFAGSIGATAVGFQSASLRGLGGTRTLVLMNGRRPCEHRIPGRDGRPQHDPAFRDRPHRGADRRRVGDLRNRRDRGVINFILRKDYRGAEAYAYYGDSEAGGGEVQRYSGTVGWGDLSKDKFNAFATLDYTKVQEIHAAQRSFSQSAYLPNAAGGVYDRTSGKQHPGERVPAGGARSLGHDAESDVPELPPAVFVPDREYRDARPVPFRLRECHRHPAALEDLQRLRHGAHAAHAAAPGLHRRRLAEDDEHLAIFAAADFLGDAALRGSGHGVSLEPVLPARARAAATAWMARSSKCSGAGSSSARARTRTKSSSRGSSRDSRASSGSWDYSTALNWATSKATDTWTAGWSRGSVLLPILNSGRINLFGLNTGPPSRSCKRPSSTNRW